MAIPETTLTLRAPADLTERVEELAKQKFNILLPTTTFASQSELFVPRLDIVIPKGVVGGDFYEQASKKVENSYIKPMAPTAQFLNKIASAANIQWHPDKCGHTVLERSRVVYKAVAAVRQADGQYRIITDEYELDLEVVEEEIRMDYKKKVKYEDFQKRMKKDGMELEDYIHRDLLQKRRHKLALAATGAMNRVIRKALTLQNSYLPEQANKPFAIARFDFQPDYSDPTVRRYASIAAVKAQNDLFGQGSATMPEGVTPEEEDAAKSYIDRGMGNAIEMPDGRTVDVGTGEVYDDDDNPPSFVDMTEPEKPTFTCGDCGQSIQEWTDAKTGKVWTPEMTVDFTQTKLGGDFCSACAFERIKQAAQARKEA